MTLDQKLDLVLELLEQIRSEIRGSAKKKAQKGPGTHLVIAAYKDAYKARFGVPATLTGKHTALLKHLSTHLGADRVIDLIQAYLQMEEAWFQTKGYDIETFNANVTKIAAALDSGCQRPGEWAGFEKLIGETIGHKRIQKPNGADN
jgi:hypothetical protein